MIDENIRRVGLTEAQYGKALKRRKELYEALHPETRKGNTSERAGVKRQNVALQPSFAADTAAKTGTSRRTVERSVALAEKLDDQAVASGEPRRVWLPSRIERIRAIQPIRRQPTLAGCFYALGKFLEIFPKMLPPDHCPTSFSGYNQVNQAHETK